MLLLFLFPPFAEMQLPPVMHVGLGDGIGNHAQSMKPSAARQAEWTGIEMRVQGQLQKLWPDAIVRRYGSSVTGLCDSDSDVDMTVLIPSLHNVAFTESSQQVPLTAPAKAQSPDQ